MMWIVFALILLEAQAGAAVHYTYSAANPSVPTRTETVSSCTSGSSEYTTYAGVPDRVQVARVVTDSFGSTYVAGIRLMRASSNSLLRNDPFVAKVDPTGCLLFTVTIDANGGRAHAIAVDSSGQIYVAGSHEGSDLPVRNALRNQPGKGFLIRLSADGSQLLTSTYIDGVVNAMVLDIDGDVYLTGQTNSVEFPDGLRASKLLPRSGVTSIGAAFFLKLSPTADRILTSGYLAGNSVACGFGSGCFLSDRNTTGLAISVDRNRNILMAGNTNITDLPTTETALRPKGIRAFAAKVTPDGSQLIYSTYLGDRNDPVFSRAFPANVLSDMTTDADGSAILTGKAYDENFPTTSEVVQPVYSGPMVAPGAGLSAQFDAFVAKLNASGSAMVWATYFGFGGRNESFESVSSDSAGNIWLSGTTKAHPSAAAGSTLIVGLDPTAGKLLFGQVFAPGWSNVLQAGRSGLIHVSGESGFVTAFRPATQLTPRILGLTNGAGGEMTGEIAPGEIVSIFGVGIGPDQPVSFALNENGRVPTALSGIRVFFGDLPAPMLYVSRNQINAIVPNGVLPQSSVAIRIADSPHAFTAQVFPSAPALFAGADGYAVRNQDGSPNHTGNPAPDGSVVTVWMTGTGADSRPDGSVAEGPRDTRCCQAMYLRAMPGVIELEQIPLEVLYAGDAPGFVTALKQVNVRVPPATTPIHILTDGGRVVSVGVQVTPRP